jgi:hypothetical protein
MNEERLKQLLDRYYKSTTTDGEEKELREYFSVIDIIPGYEAEKEIFCHYADTVIVPEPSDDLEQRILKSIDEIEMIQKNRFSVRQYVAILSVAATILLLMGSYLIFFQRSKLRDTYSDPQIAYAETMKILNNISLKMKRGTMELQPLKVLGSATRTSMESIDRSALLISDGMKKIEVFNKLSEVGNQTNNSINNK